MENEATTPPVEPTTAPAPPDVDAMTQAAADAIRALDQEHDRAKQEAENAAWAVKLETEARLQRIAILRSIEALAELTMKANFLRLEISESAKPDPTTALATHTMRRVAASAKQHWDALESVRKLVSDALDHDAEDAADELEQLRNRLAQLIATWRGANDQGFRIKSDSDIPF